MNVEILICLANCSPAELISTSFHTKHRFYESYWLFHCLRIHWFFSLIVFSTDAGKGKAASVWCADSTDISTKRGSKNRYLAGRSSQAHAWKAAELEGWHKPVERLFLSPAPLLGGHLFLIQRGFDLFASASASSIYKGHEREWVIHLSVCMWVCMCVLGLTYFCCTDVRLAFKPHKYNCRHRPTVACFPHVDRTNVRTQNVSNTKYEHKSSVIVLV